MTHVSTFLLPVALERGWIHHQPANINSPILFFFPKGKVWGQGARTCMRVTGVGGGGLRKGALTAKRPHLWSLAGLSGQHGSVPPRPGGACSLAAICQAYARLSFVLLLSTLRS